MRNEVIPEGEFVRLYTFQQLTSSDHSRHPLVTTKLQESHERKSRALQGACQPDHKLAPLGSHAVASPRELPSAFEQMDPN